MVVNMVVKMAVDRAVNMVVEMVVDMIVNMIVEKMVAKVHRHDRRPHLEPSQEFLYSVFCVSSCQHTTSRVYECVSIRTFM